MSSWGSKPDGCHCYCHHECECKDDGKGDVPDSSLGELPEGPLTSESDSSNEMNLSWQPFLRYGYEPAHSGTRLEWTME